MPLRSLLFFAVLSLGLASCKPVVGEASLLGFKAPIPVRPQGNLIQKEQYEKLEAGMTPEQVIFLLGRPVLSSPFSLGEWHYVTHVQQGAKKVLSHVHLVVKFNEKVQLSDWGFRRGDIDELQRTFDRDVDADKTKN